MKTKRLGLRLLVLLGLLTLMVVPAAPAAADTAVSIDVPPQVSENSNFIARVNIGSVTDFDAAQYDITYDPAVIEVTDVTDGLIGGTPIPVDMWASISSTTIRVINNVGGRAGVTGSGYLAEIHFHVVGTAGASSDIILENGILGDKDAQPIAATWAGGSVEVVAAVTADFSADVNEVLVDQNVSFTANPAGGSGIYTYAWDFGDSQASPEANPTHSYAASGTYTVSLTVTDSLGNSDIETKTDYITIYAAMVADFSADISEALVGQTITFNPGATTGGSGSYTYAWEFGDTETSTEANPTHSYAASGAYTVSLTVTDALDGSDTEIKADYITVYEALVAGFSANINEAVVGQDITFDSSATAGGKPGYTYAWDFGDSQASPDANPTHSYAASGPYTVSLTVIDALGNPDDSGTVSVTVYKLGDADKSGEVDVIDITYVEHIIMVDAGYAATTWADANEDGFWNVTDVTAIEWIIIP